jgi:hypothetical protein
MINRNGATAVAKVRRSRPYHALIAVGLVRLHGRVEGWKLALVLIAVFALVSVIR